MIEFTLTVQEEGVGERIDKWLALQNEDWTRSQIQDWIKHNRVTVNRASVKGNYRLKLDDEVKIEVEEPQPLDIPAENIPVDIIYEDKDVVVVNKPRGMVVHPAPGHGTGTLVNALLYQCDHLSGINGVMRPGIVHRIDKDTSGVLVVAKNDRAHLSLSEQLQKKITLRKYVAIVHGVIPHELGTIDAPIGRDTQDRKKMAVTTENSKEAVTHFTVLERFQNYTLVECQLETGRTHQIRVHMKYIHHPVAGDPKYGPKKTLPITGQALHAQTLGFYHPTTQEWMEFSAPIPKDMEDVLKNLQKTVDTNDKL
ncbi:RluA family pseudouridine synthase [Massilibacterium senegalense]|uniref:RluA family pseudouridine synthase n=1 Tax=Massilibacterium senegalense TaxID=1632858 RepID=UPI0007862B5A|nr:RluA family pseudouridine synthase [Massilibacterium senegalense]